MRFLGGITKVYDVYFLHQRNDEVEYETIEANIEKDAIKLAIAKHRKTYPKVRFQLLKVK